MMAAARAAAADWPDSDSEDESQTIRGPAETRKLGIPASLARGAKRTPAPWRRTYQWDPTRGPGPGPLRVKFAESDCHWFKFQATWQWFCPGAGLPIMIRAGGPAGSVDHRDL